MYFQINNLPSNSGFVASVEIEQVIEMWKLERVYL